MRTTRPGQRVTRQPDRRTGVFVALPVLNEAENILPLLDSIDVALDGRRYVVCVIDDGSRDGTVELLRQREAAGPDTLHVVYRTKTRRGSQRGGALLTALEWGLDQTDCDVFVEMDGDLSHRPEELQPAVELVRSGSCDVAIASKFVPGSQITNRPLTRRFVSRACSAAVWLLLSRRVKDYSNGFRFYTRNAAEVLRRTQMRYTSPIYLSEALAIWLKSGLEVRELPTTYIGRNEGVSKLRWIDLGKAALAVFEISTRYHFRGFRTKGETSQASASRERDLSVRG
jgi:dolichol-phosphate mannosyltransferase